MPVPKLDKAPRCQHTKMNNSPCAAPARRGGKYCVFHEAAHSPRPDYSLRLVEDAMSLQFSLYQVMRLLTNQEVDTKRAALMLYALQIAASNLKRLHEETNEITARAEDAEEESLLKMIWKQLQIPEPLEDAMAAVAAQIPDLPTTTASRVSCASPK